MKKQLLQPSSSMLRIKSRKESPCLLSFDGVSDRKEVQVHQRGVPERIVVQKKKFSPPPISRQQQKQQQTKQPAQTKPQKMKICQARKADGKKCTYASKCISQKTGKQYCGVHSKYCNQN